MIELNRENFEEEVLKAPGKVLVNCYGDGCCIVLTPHIKVLEEKYRDKLKFTSLNTSKARMLAMSQKALGLPTVIIYEKGQKLAECDKNNATPENVENMIKAHI